jgi:hypothetical protein
MKKLTFVFLNPEKRYFAKFGCGCGNTWKSANAWKFHKQQCRRCVQWVGPYAWYKLRPSDNGGGSGPHNQDECTKCKELGSKCSRYYDNDDSNDETDDDTGSSMSYGSGDTESDTGRESDDSNIYNDNYMYSDNDSDNNSDNYMYSDSDNDSDNYMYSDNDNYSDDEIYNDNNIYNDAYGMDYY